MRISDWSSDVCSSDLPPRCDMIAISAHKVHGPKGIGALWLRDDVALTPVIHGGGQEGGLRSGTLSPALCAGFGDRKSVGEGKSVSVRVDLGGRRSIKKKKAKNPNIVGNNRHKS